MKQSSCRWFVTPGRPSGVTVMLTSSIPHTEIREPPQVTQSYSIADTGQQELHLVPPATTICRRLLLTFIALRFRVCPHIDLQRITVSCYMRFLRFSHCWLLVRRIHVWPIIWLLRKKIQSFEIWFQSFITDTDENKSKSSPLFDGPVRLRRTVY